jgi:putative zinc finger/helix-turn-helix YgiT family protein
MTCFECGEGTLIRQVADVPGEIKRKKYVVRTQALVCDKCGHIALEGRDTQEFMRRVADAYRSANNLLTSEQIRSLRGAMSQQRFADAVGLSVASIKRWELGLVQDKKSNKILLDYSSRAVPRGASYRFERATAAEWNFAAVLESANGPPGQQEQQFHSKFSSL